MEPELLTNLILNKYIQFQTFTLLLRDEDGYLSADIFNPDGTVIIYAQNLRYGRDLFFNIRTTQPIALLPFRSDEEVLINPDPTFNLPVPTENLYKMVILNIPRQLIIDVRSNFFG